MALIPLIGHFKHWCRHPIGGEIGGHRMVSSVGHQLIYAALPALISKLSWLGTMFAQCNPAPDESLLPRQSSHGVETTGGARPRMTNDERHAIYEALLAASVGGRVPASATAAAMLKYQRDRRTINRLWQRGQTTRLGGAGPAIVSSKVRGMQFSGSS